MSPVTNPYTAPEQIPTREDAYAPLGPRAGFVADSDPAPYTDAGDAWAPRLDSELFGAGTDAHRLRTQPTRDFRPNPHASPETGFYPQRDADTRTRHSVETVDADGWTERQGGSGKRAAPHPESNRPADTRPTMSMAPRSYSFLRPFDKHAARSLTGQHFSMADHRREYDILGMEPPRTARNTYRIDPAPWDANMMDVPASTVPANHSVRAVEVPPARNPAHRLV